MCLGIPGRIVEIVDAGNKLGLVEIGGIRRQVNLACVVDADHPVEACVGEWVIVHVGFAMSRIDERQAAETLETLAELGDMQAEMAAMQSSGTG